MSDTDTFRSLAGKLRSMELDAAEATALATILRRARDAEPEVEGFGFDIGSLGFKNSDGVLRGADRGFKGSDEELQALVDWLLEAR